MEQGEKEPYEPMRNSVSVVIPVYNAEPFVEAAIRSALALPEVLEVIVVDDAGPDNSLEVCQRMAAADARVRSFRHPDLGNHGAAASRNLGYSKAQGTYVAFLDADDAFLPERFAAERRIFAEHPDADGVYGALGVLFHTEEARVHYTKVGLSELTTVSHAVPPEQLFRALVETGKGFGYFSLVAVTLKRTALERLPYVYPDDVVLHEDSQLTFRLAYHIRLYAGSISAPIALRGVHAANRISNNAREHYTRSTLYKSLWNWACTVPMEEDLRRRLLAEHVRYQVLNAGNPISVIGQSRWFLGRAWLLDLMDVRKAFFDRLFGRDSGLSLFGQKVTWRVLHWRPWSSSSERA